VQELFGWDKGAANMALRFEYGTRLAAKLHVPDVNRHGFAKRINLSQAIIADNALQYH
jgi:hypothetical protein